MQVATWKPCPHLLAICLGLATLTAWARQPDPLFANNDVMAFTLKAPFRKINAQRNKDKLYDGSLTFTDQGQEISLPVKLQSRGNYRLERDICRYVPLRIHFQKKSVKDTLFDKQKKLKPVTLCQRPSVYKNYLIQEYLIYRMFNVLTDSSFKVKLAEVTYLELDGSGKPRTSYGFFIEDKKRMGKRLDLKAVPGHKILVKALDPTQISLVSLFQFMVGNTDWSATKGETDEDCCHNAKMLGKEGQRHTVVPYDFDFSGLINAKYAAPTPGLPIRNIKIRLYRGFCKPDLIGMRGARATIQQHKEELYAFFETNELVSESARKKSLKYLDSYYKISESDKNFEKKVTTKCRG